MPERIKYKLFDHEVTPPPATWEAIASRLNDDSQHALLASKMNQFEVTPPESLWSVISTNLDITEKKAERITGSIFFRIAAAAAVIGIMAIGYWWINKAGVNQNLATTANKKINTAKPADLPTKENAVNNSIPNNSKQQEMAASELVVKQNSNDENEIKPAVNDAGILRYATVSAVPSYNEHSIVINSQPIRDESGAIVRDMNALTTNNNYMIIAGPDGQMTRISSKFANVIRFLNVNGDDTEEYLDRVIKEGGIWKQRFKEWRQKILDSHFIPSSNNFLDIIEFKELIEDKQ